MACDAVTDYLERESGRIVEDVLRRDLFATSPWLALIQRGIWPRGMGEDLNVVQYERNAPSTVTPTWEQVQIVDGTEGGACLPPHETIPVGSTKRTFYLYRRVLHGPDFCAVELNSAFQLAQQLDAITEILKERVRIEWEQHDRDEYMKHCRTKVVVDGCPPSEDTTMAASWAAVFTNLSLNCTTLLNAASFSILTQGILDRYRAKLIRDGAVFNALGKRNGSPIITLICSGETSENIIRLNSDIRQDLRWGEPSKLLAPFGVSQDYRGFYHLIDPYPRRWACSNGSVVEVPQFTLSAATKGQKAEINTSWETASLEESFLFDPSVFRQLVPQPITNPAPGFRFDPVSYVGTARALNIPDRNCNPDGTILFHRMVMAAGSMPLYPQRGVAFLHLRCDPACSLVTACTT